MIKMEKLKLSSMVCATLVVFLLSFAPIYAQETEEIDIEKDEVTLENYPDLFLDGKDLNFIVGSKGDVPTDSLGGIDISTSLQYYSKEEVSTEEKSSTNVVDGIQKNLKLGDSLVNNQTGFKEVLKEFDGLDLYDGEVSYQGKEYNTHEEITDIKGNVLYSGKNNDEFDDNVVVSLTSMSLCYVFDESIKLNSNENLKIRFLGKNLEIVDVDNNEIKIISGTEYFMDVGDTVTIDGKKITLLNVGSRGSVIIEVDGTIDTVSKDYSKEVNGIQVIVDEEFYANTKEERSASLILGEEAERIYEDEDTALNFGEEDWVYDLYTNNDEIIEKDKICLSYNKNHKDVTDEDDEKALYVGDSVDLPNNKGFLLFESVTEPKMIDVDFEKYDDDNVENATALFKLSIGRDEGFNNEYDEIYVSDSYEFIDEDGISLGTLVSMSDNSDVSFEIVGNNLSINNVKDNQIVLEIISDKLDKIWYGSEDLSTKEQNIRTAYGLVITNPENTIDDDENHFNVEIPTAQVEARVSIGTKVSKETKSEITSYLPKKLDVNGRLDSEGYNQDNNLIIIGGSCANDIFEKVSGIPCSDWETEVGGEGKAIVMIKEYEGNLALLVAGTDGVDTRAVAKLLSDWDNNKDKFIGKKVILSV